MKLKLEVKGLQQYARNLRKANVKKGAEEGLHKASLLITRMARKEHFYTNRTGNLTRSTGFEDAKPLSSIFFATMPYAKFQYFGTRFIVGDPWIGRAIIRGIPEIQREIERQVVPDLRRELLR